MCVESPVSYCLQKELMALKTCELAQQRPAELTDEILKLVSEHLKWFIVLSFHSLLNSDANRPKYPATLSLRKEGNGNTCTLYIVLMFTCGVACYDFVVVVQWPMSQLQTLCLISQRLTLKSAYS